MSALKFNSGAGFTLIELLVVVSIIGLLSSIILASLNNARKKARDARRLLAMNQIQKALEFYYDKYGVYPGPVASYGEFSVSCGGWDSSAEDVDGDGKFFIEPLADEGFLSVVPGDPLQVSGTCSGFHFRYFRYSAGTTGCSSAKGEFYVLGVRDMETSAIPYPGSPGWRCPENCTIGVNCTRNWQDEFDWVVGRFEKP